MQLTKPAFRGMPPTSVSKRRSKAPPGEYLLSCALSFALTLMLTELFHFPFGSLNMLGSICLCTFALWLCARLRILRYLLPMSLLAGLLVFLFTLDLQEAFPKLVEFWTRYTEWVEGIVTGADISGEEVPPFAAISAAFMGVCVGLPLYLMVRGRLHFGCLLLVGAVPLFAMQMLGEVSFPLLLIYFLLTLVYAIRREMFGLPDTAPRGRLLLLGLPLCALCLFCAWRLPVPNVSPGQPLTDHLMEMTLTTAVTTVELDIFSLAQMEGEPSLYGDFSSNLGGPHQAGESRRTLLFLDGPRPQYLRGRVSDTYNGKTWRLNESSSSSLYTRFQLSPRYPFFSFPRSVSGASDLLSQWQQPLALLTLGLISEEELSIEKTEVYYGDIATRSVFLPSDTVDLVIHSTFALQTGYRLNGYGVMQADATRQREFSYTVYTPRYALSRERMAEIYTLSHPGFAAELAEISFVSDSEIIRELVSLAYSDDGEAENAVFYNAQIGRYEEWTVEEGLMLLPQHPFWEQVAKEARDIQARYTALPASLPQRVSDLARSIVSELPEDASTYEKARTIEQYLAAHYTYSLDLPPTPEERDFVDFFLFDLDRGYCTYFATAMTVLCRALDIPARYVEGFSPNYQKEGTFYRVTSAQGHAWPEIYLEGFGWVSFEPTPGRTGTLYASSASGVGEAVIPTSAPTPTIDMSPYEDVAAAGELSTASPELPPADESVPIPRAPYFLLVLPALGILPLFNLLKRRRDRRKMEKAEATPDQVEWFYQKITAMYAHIDQPRRPNETPREYGLRLDAETGATMTRMGELYCAARYGGLSAGKDDLAQMKELWKKREGIVSDRRGNGIRWIYKHILGYL